jgi:MarR family transcriptional regulator, 2-MHQ and catechol-resistance regulon repressor
MIMPTHYSGTPQETLALNTFIRLTRSVDSLASRLSQRGTQGDLTESQFGVLESLYHLGSMCQNQLASKILKSSGNLTMVIDNLEKRGLVHRVRDLEDRRKIQVQLTEEGRQLIAQVFPGHVASITEEMSTLTPQEQETLGSLCRKLGQGKASQA